jgi:hypothetical protein
VTAVPGTNPLIAEAIPATSYSWHIAIDGSHSNPTFDLLFGNQFNFMLFQVDADTPFATSVTFNISNSTVNQYGQLIKPTSSSATLTGTSSTAKSTGSSASASASATKAASSGLGSSAKIGIGVGVGVGGAAILAAVLVVYCGMYRRRGHADDHARLYHHHQQMVDQKHANNHSNTVPAVASPVEMYGSSPVSHMPELHGTGPRASELQ